MKKFLFIFTIAITLFSCTDNNRVKNYGGTATIDLPANTKLVNCTWKGEQMWTLTRDMTETDSAETYKFKEYSSFGIIEGTYIIKESKSKR